MSEPTCILCQRAMATLLADPSFSREGRLLFCSVDDYQGAQIDFYERGKKARSTQFEIKEKRSWPQIIRSARIEVEPIRVMVDDLLAVLPAESTVKRPNA